MQPQLARFGWLLWVILIVGCATTNVTKIDRASNPVTLLCIEENPKVWVKEFLPFLETSFQSYGIKTIVHQENSIPGSCEYALSYTAFQLWDFVPYVYLAEIRIRRGTENIAMGRYNINRNQGGFLALNKWASIETKMTPVIDELLIDFRDNKVVP